MVADLCRFARPFVAVKAAAAQPSANPVLSQQEEKLPGKFQGLLKLQLSANSHLQANSQLQVDSQLQENLLQAKLLQAEGQQQVGQVQLRLPAAAAE
jgi:hypothetical protein